MWAHGAVLALVTACQYGHVFAERLDWETNATLDLLEYLRKSKLGYRPAKPLESNHLNKRTIPSVTFHIIGYNSTKRPRWAAHGDKVHIFVPSAECRPCPASARKPRPSRMWETKGWWCAQRQYMGSMKALLKKFPDSDYYMLIDADTLVFSRLLRQMMTVLESRVLGPEDDLYMGHGFSGLRKFGIPTFIMTGGGVLVRGNTMRKLGQHLDACHRRHVAGDRCWHHLDWGLAECLRDIGVQPRGHEAFQQFFNDCKSCCDATVVACHPVPQEKQNHMEARHLSLLEDSEVELLGDVWARPCSSYNWYAVYKSRCHEASKRPGFLTRVRAKASLLARRQPKVAAHPVSLLASSSRRILNSTTASLIGVSSRRNSHSKTASHITANSHRNLPSETPRVTPRGASRRPTSRPPRPQRQRRPTLWRLTQRRHTLRRPLPRRRAQQPLPRWRARRRPTPRLMQRRPRPRPRSTVKEESAADVASEAKFESGEAPPTVEFIVTDEN